MNIFDLFRAREWRPQTIPSVRGSFAGLTLELLDFPCQVDRRSGARRYAYDDFGAEFIEALHRALGDVDGLRQAIAASGVVERSITLRQLLPIAVRLSGRVTDSRRQFESDIADAAMAAFKSGNIEP